jgi:hypothetical protein
MYGVSGMAKPTGVASPTISYHTDTVGNQWALWFGTDGSLRTASAPDVEVTNFNWNTGGLPVGGQVLREEPASIETKATTKETKK